LIFVNFTGIATLGLLMKCTVELTDVERHTLQQLSLNHRHRDFRIRATGLLLRARGLKVQDGWSPRGKPHCVTPNPHCRRSVMGALDFGANTLIHEATKQSVKRPAVIQFLDRVAQQADQRPTVVVLDNASIHHDIDHETLDRWLIEHRMMLFYLPPYSPELNMIEILWKQAKYHWRRFVTWTRDTIDSEIDALLGAYGSTYQIRFH
jgi:transposase